MKKLIVLLIAGIFIAGPASAKDVKSLRGGLAIPGQQEAPKVFKTEEPKEVFKRTFKEQPPLVAHKIDLKEEKYRINLKQNGCLSCHDKVNYKEKKAPLAGKSHYVGKDGKEGSSISMSRYFCNQCHVIQTMAKPLVENTFKGAK